MLRAKRRRTRMHDKEGNPIFNTKNATVKQNHYEMKNNYLSYLKTKQNSNLGCKKYYSEEEIEEIHHNNVLDTKLTVNIGNSILDPDKNCSAGFGILVPIPNTKDFSGDYTYYNKTTYYIDEIKSITYNGNDIPTIMFITYIGFTWCILAIQCVPPEGSSVILKKTIDNVNRIYDLYLSNNAQYKIDFERDIKSFCWALYITDKAGLPITAPNLDLYYNQIWTIGTEYGNNKTIGIQITPDVKHSTAIIIKNKLIASKYCKTKSVPRNPLQGYRKQLITDHSIQKTLPITPTLNISNTEILSLLERIGLDYFNTPINFSGQYKLINKNQVIKLDKFNIFYEKLHSNNYEKYDISYFHSEGEIFNGWVLRYRNTKHPIYNVQYRYVVSDSHNNRSLVNALKNIITTNFFLQETNDAPFYKGFFGLIDTSITIKNGDLISLKDVQSGKVWEGTVYGVIYRNDSNIDRNQFYIGNLTKTHPFTKFPYSSTDVSINGGPTITTNISFILSDIGLINPNDFSFTKTETIPESYCDGDMVKPQPINTVYKDNYAKSCGSYRKEGVASNDFCYNNVIKSVQNKNGQINQAYNYSSAQYYSRFCANDCSNNCNIVYKKNNPKFSTQGAVSGGSRLNRLKYQTITKSQQVVKDYNKVDYETKIIDSFSENYSLNIGKYSPTPDSIIYGLTGLNGSITPNLFKNLTITLCYFQKNVHLDNYQFIIEFSQKLDNILKPSEISSLSLLIKYKDLRINIPFSDLTTYNPDPPGFQYVFLYSSKSQNYSIINRMITIDNPIGKNFDIIIHYTLENKIIEKIPINRKIVSNKVNGSQPVSIYRNTFPIYKQNLNGLIKCKTHAYNGARQNCPTPFNKKDCNRLKTLQSFR